MPGGHGATSGVGLPFSGAHWVDNVARHACRDPDGVALRFEGRSITWSALDARVRRAASALAKAGVGKGDRVVVLMTNRPEFIEVTLAANALGAIAVPVNFRLAPREVAYVLSDSEASLVATDVLLAGLAASAQAASGSQVPTLVVGQEEEEGPGGALRYEAALDAADDDRVGAEVSERDVALVMYTSGTTGRPKGAMLTHLNLLLQAITTIRTSRLWRDDEVALLNVPLFHIAGIANLPPAFLLGLRTVLMPSAPFDAEATLAVVEEEGVTQLFLVPAQWQVLCEHPGATSRSASLRTISWGAAPATVSLLERMAEVFPHAEVVSVFGQTEMSPVTTALEAEDAVRKIGSIGKPVATIVARVVDDELCDVAPGEVGEIVYRGPTLMAGYWGNPQATEEAYRGGWFHSGDLVRADEEGYLYVVDRRKDMIISGGENIYCVEVESVLSRHPGVREVAVVGAPHPRWGETPVAVVVPTDPDQPPSLEDLQAFIRDDLASFKKPTSLVVVDELPRNASGKVRKDVLRGRVAELAP
jgi:fatty-acyl-CoA synthase